ncbi:MAG: glycosyltransferase family 39 protein [Pseudomonadota bacterium]
MARPSRDPRAWLLRSTGLDGGFGRAGSHDAWLLLGLAAVLIALGLWCRTVGFGFPPTFLFDEHHFVENARNYLNQAPDWNDHPPLGKLFIAASIRVFGDRSYAWRVPSLVEGLLLVVVGAVAAARLFRSRLAGLLAAALLATDGFLIAYSRAALLDCGLGLAGVTALLLATFRWRAGLAVGAGVLVGLAANIKFTGIGNLLPLAASLLLGRLAWRRTLGLAALTGAVAIVTYFVAYGVGLAVDGQPHGVRDVVAASAALVLHHAALTDMKNPWVSGWITWFVPVRPLVMGYFGWGSGVRVLSSLGNLIVWWSAAAAAVAVAVRIAWIGLAAALREPSPAGPDAGSVASFVGHHGRAALVVLALIAAHLFPWMASHRDSYIYHYLPSYAGMVILLAGLLAHLGLRRPRELLILLAAVLAFSIVYGPLWAMWPITEQQFRWRLPFESWR